MVYDIKYASSRFGIFRSVLVHFLVEISFIASLGTKEEESSRISSLLDLVNKVGNGVVGPIRWQPPMHVQPKQKV